MQYTEEAIKNRKNKEIKIKKSIKRVVYIILIPMLIYNFLLILQAVINPSKTPSVLGMKMYVIVSGSMSPELEIGDIVIVEELQNEDVLEKQDIISFRHGHSVVTHRIVDVIDEGGIVKYQTRGDHNNTEDLSLVSRDDIEGKFKKKITGIGKIVFLLRNKTLIIAIVIFYYIFLMHDQNLQNKKSIRKLKREKYEMRKRKEKHEENQK